MLVAHVLMSQLSSGGKDCEGDVIYPSLYQRPGFITPRKPLAAGVTQVDRHYSLSYHLGQWQEIRVATQIPAAADGDLVGYAAHAFLGHIKDYQVHRFEARIALHNSAGTVVTAFFERHAILAAEGFNALYSFKITVAAKTPTIQSRPSPDIGKYIHREKRL
jgi:hypothetical protein